MLEFLGPTSLHVNDYPWASVFTSDPGLHAFAQDYWGELNVITNAKHLAHGTCLIDVN